MENIGGLGQPSFDLKLNGPQPAVLQALLRIDKVLQGEVLQLLDGNTIVLGVGQYRIPAQSHVELRLGAKFNFQVVEQGDEIVLKILPEANAQKEPQTPFQLFQKTAGQDRPMAELVEKLAEVILALSDSTGKSSGAPGKTSSFLNRDTLSFLRELVQSLPQELVQTPSTPASQTSNAVGLTPTLLPEIPTATPQTPDSAASTPFPPQTPTAVTTPSSANPTVVVETPLSSQTPLPELLNVPSQNVGADPANLKNWTAPNLENAAGETLQAKDTAAALLSAYNEVSLQAPTTSPSTLEKNIVQHLRSITQLISPELQAKASNLASLIQRSVVREEASSDTIRKNFEEAGTALESRLKQALQDRDSNLAENLTSKDFKAAVLSLEKEIETVLEKLPKQSDLASEKSLKELLNVVKESREAVESKQLQNAWRQDLNEALHFQIPFHDAQQLKTADLFYKKGNSKGKDGEPADLHHLVFMLEMSRIGPLRVDALVREKQLDLFVRIENSEAADFVKTQLPLLSSALQAIGFDTGVFECTGGLKKEENQAPEEFQLPVSVDRPLLDLEG